ncbi:MAG: hypothetical protein MJE77_27500 [Proteobacteria bacterium]|nr:hypothetical protein [Pseudomonadota bacterium]
MSRNFILIGVAAAAVATTLSAGCRGSASANAQSDEPPADPRCAPFETVSEHPMGLAGARQAHRRAALRRYLRLREAATPGHIRTLTAAIAPQHDIVAGRVCFAELYEAGRILFEHEFSFADGLGDDRARSGMEAGQSPFRRVHRGASGGPETISCTSCHWRGGPAGAGAVQDNSLLLGDGDRPDSADARNPPPLHGVGVVQALAREMTDDLAAIRRELIATARRTGRTVERTLASKGVGFGVLRADKNGSLDASAVEGVDADLIIRPFGWKGNVATLREFVADSLRVHFGITSERDRSAEFTRGQMTALIVYLAAQALPIHGPPDTEYNLEEAAEGLLPPPPIRFHEAWSRGRLIFDELGCASCHRPFLVLKDPRFTTVDDRGNSYTVDLSTRAEPPRISYDSAMGGYPVWLFSDLKRHDMGADNAARHVHDGVPRSAYMTRRLWGLAHSSPYFHDGRAPVVDVAIRAHGGDAEHVRLEFEALSHAQKNQLRVFLMSMRRAAQLSVP